MIPKPGTTRLISSNADGLHTSFALGANVYTNNIVRRTCDDLVAIAAPWIATVNSVSGATVSVVRNYPSPFPPNAPVTFVNPATDAIIGTATIVSESPAFAQQQITDGEMVTLTLDHAVSGLAANFAMTDNDPSKLGSGSMIAFNTLGSRVLESCLAFRRTERRGTRQLYQADEQRRDLHSAVERR